MKGNNLIKKGVVVAVILLFVSVSVIPSTGSIIEKKSPMSTLLGNILYVGGNGTGNYSKIQDAIDDSSDGDMVFVYNGTYYENLIVDKSINLIGEDRDTTIIDGNEIGDVVCVSADGINISGFTVQNSGDYEWDSGILLKSSFCNISKNKILENSEGIYFDYHNGLVSNNIISNNIVSSNIYTGIILINSDNNRVSNNIVTANIGNGIAILESNNNYIQNNVINKNNWYGLILGTCSNNTFTGNIIESNKKYGIHLYSVWSGELKGGCNNSIFRNTIKNNSGGISLNYSSNNNIIEKNNFIANNRQASFKESWGNFWNENYWNNWIGVKIKLPIFQKFPKIIYGNQKFPPTIFGRMIHWFNFDWHPAQEPYDIEV